MSGAFIILDSLTKEAYFHKDISKKWTDIFHIIHLFPDVATLSVERL